MLSILQLGYIIIISNTRQLFTHSVLSSAVCFCLFQLPYFMNELTLTELDMGSATPRILGASKPSIDYRGKREIHFTHHTHTHTHIHTHTHTPHSGFCKEILACLASNTNWVVCGALCSVFWEVSHQCLILVNPKSMLKGLKAKQSCTEC